MRDHKLKDWAAKVGARTEGGRLMLSHDGQQYWLDVSPRQFEAKWPQLAESAARLWPTTEVREATWNLLDVLLEEALDVADGEARRLVLREDGFHAI